MRDDQDKALQAGELVVRGGTWSGLLFDNPHIGLAPALTWGFTFDFQKVVRHDGDMAVSVTVDWLPLPQGSRQRIAPRQVHSAPFAQPAEASVYFFEHHRFDSVDLHLHEQRGLDVRARATLRGDLDNLGLDPFSAEGWLSFDGIRVALSGVTSPKAALERLSAVTDTDGLVPATHTHGDSVHFRVGGGPRATTGRHPPLGEP